MGQTPAPHPEAVLLRRARQAGRLNIPDAATRAGISHQRWGQVERSERGRAPADTLAHMAHAVGIKADRLASEYPDDDHLRNVTGVLREIELQEATSVPAAERRLRELIPLLRGDDRSVVEELYADFLQQRDNEERRLEKVVALVSRLHQKDRDR